MVTCAVTSCKNTSGKISKNKDGITFHRFPRDKERRKRWEVAVNRELDWTSTSSSTVCSQHFGVNDFYLTESGLRRLSMDALPTMNISPVEDVQSSMMVNSLLLIVDIKAKDSEEVIDLKNKVRRLEVISENRKRRLRLMRQSKQRLEKRVKMLDYVFKHLMQNKKIRTSLENRHKVKLSSVMMP